MDDNTNAAIELERVLFEIKKVIVGQDHMVERLLVALLARGHILLEGLPGLAKTLAVSTMARAIGGSFVRLQFTPDLLPSDLVGTRIWRASEERFDTEWGPVFANLLLTDEINRAPASPPCLKSWPSVRCRSAARPVNSPAPSWSWPPRTRLSPRASTRSRRRSGTAS